MLRRHRIGADREEAKSRMRVWIDEWQYACCGDRFEVGDTVAWTLREGDRAWLSSLFGRRLPDPLPLHEERHGDLPDQVPATRGVVRGIEAVFARFVEQPGPEGGFQLEPGSARPTPIQESREPGPAPEGLSLEGFLVDLDAWDPEPQS